MGTRRLIIAAVCCLIAGLCFLGVYSLELRHRANRLVRICYGFSEHGSSPSLDEIRKAFGSDLQQLGPYSHDGCGYEVNVSNGLLHALRIAPYTNLRSQFWEEKGVMQSNSVYFYAMSHGMVDVLVKYCRACDPPNVYPYESASTSFTGYVEIDLPAPEIARKKLSELIRGVSPDGEDVTAPHNCFRPYGRRPGETRFAASFVTVRDFSMSRK